MFRDLLHKIHKMETCITAGENQKQGGGIERKKRKKKAIDLK